jgi:TolA-binding protein
MAHLRKAPLVALVVALAAAALPAQSARSAGALSQGIELFNSGMYDKAIPVFRAIVADPAAEASRPAAALFLAKSAMAAGDLDEAEKSLEFYISRYPKAPDFPEAQYQKGRLLYMQGQYESAVQSLRGFLAGFPRSPFVSNAYFWVGESLYAMGRLDDALQVYRKIVRDYPASFKAEASQYRASLIELGRREVELSKLLKWSHEEYLRNIGEYQRREAAYEQAIEAYQKRLAASSTGQYGQYERTIAELRDELARKSAEADALAAELAQGGAAAAAAPPPVAVEAPPAVSAEEQAQIARMKELLDLKAQALALKEQYLTWLQSTVNAPAVPEGGAK